ncbi:outer membrane lipoprotein carrier protein LolA [Microbacterium kribbense]|uniref:Outer membrane lipoprotein carrier protein LolA n=1 Tax=Microbacterium kribbense TaxID=433645 RepID=A0ABP7GJM8_9MICO
MSRVWVRWLPAIVIPVVIAGGTLAANAQMNVTVPDRTPAQVLALAAGSSVHTFSGTVQQTSDLGLPELPSTGPAAGMAGAAGASGADAAAASAIGLLTGTHTARIYADGPAKQRIQVMDALAERDLIRNGTQLWLYDSNKATATHLSLPSASAPPQHEIAATPAEVAQRLLKDLTPSTAVTLGEAVSVAGHDAYDLVLTPRTSGTLIGSVSIAVDAQNGFPLSVAVTARGAQSPALHVAFTHLDYRAPAADLFTFSPPAGTTVTQQKLPALPARPEHGAAGPGHGTDQAHQPTLTGTGWATIVQLRAGSVPTAVHRMPLLNQLTTPAASGRVLSTSLVNVLLTQDGRVFAGSVPVSALEAAADR